MTIVKVWIILNMLVLSLALARAEDTPKERALLERSQFEFTNSLSCSTKVYELLDKIKDLQAKLDATKPKKD